VIVQPSSLRPASPTSLFAEMTTTCVVLITLPFSVAAGFGDPFSETPGGRPLAVSLAVARGGISRDVTRRKETMCLAVLRCAGAMKISTASLPRDREKINITFSEREEGRERERERDAEKERINTMN